ncbi:MAG: hypothetical protein GVY29_10955 [Spirochaetes bacterium]|jgi:hypothetical protein|nr:hypothetical protein [Spirochaetota bacterium]
MYVSLRSKLSSLMICLLLAPVAFAIGVPEEDPTIHNPPVTRVALYTSGIGYFEHSASVTGAATVQLTVPEDEVSDLLKSLVVQDPKGTVEAVTYDSREPLSRALAQLSVDVSRNASWRELFAQLRGAAVTVRADRELSGRITGVEAKPGAGEAPPSTYMSIMTDAGLTRVDTAAIRSVSFDDPALEADFRQGLALLDDGRNQETATIRIRLSGSGSRTVNLGYTREAPIWKTSYRLVLNGNDTATLLGWGVVENPSRQAWESARVSLLSGSPIAFSMDLANPIYVRRPEVEVPRSLSVAPQSYQKSAELPRAARSRAAPAPAAEFEMLADDMASGAATPDFTSSVEAGATGSAVGALFRYEISDPVTLPAQGAAMLPILVETLPVRDIAVFDPAVQSRHPLRGGELENSTTLHISSGPVTVLEAGSFVGDSLLPSVDPGSTQILTYAVDLETEVSRNSTELPARLTALKATDGVLTIRRTLRRTTRYRITYRGDSPRDLIIEHPKRAEWLLLQPADAVTQTATAYRIERALEVPDGESRLVEVEVREERPVSESVQLLPAAVSSVAFYLEEASLSPELRAALIALRDLKKRLQELQTELQQAESEISAIYRGQERIRQNMEQLDRDSDLYRRYVDTLGQQEDRLAELSAERNKLEDQIQRQRERISDFLANLDVE